MQIIANCKVCGTNLVGEKLNKIGSNYYCHAHYSVKKDRVANRETEARNRRQKRLVTPFNNFIDTDFDNWTATNITVSGKNLTSSAGGSILIDTEMIFGNLYNLSTRIIKNGVGVKFYNYCSSITTEIKDGTFLSLGSTIILEMDGGGTITVEKITLVEA